MRFANGTEMYVYVALLPFFVFFLFIYLCVDSKLGMYEMGSLGVVWLCYASGLGSV